MAATNTIKTQTIFAEQALDVLENELMLAGEVWRMPESEYKKEPNGFKIGATLYVKKPPKYVPTNSATASVSNSTEDEVTIAVDQRWHVAVDFATADLTQKVTKFKERFVKPMMVPLADKVDATLATRYKDLYHYVGTAGNSMATFEDMQAVDDRYTDLSANKLGTRKAVFSRTDYSGLVSGAKSHFEQSIVREALRENFLGRYAGVETFRSIHINNHTGGAGGGTPLVNGASQTGASLITDGWTASTAILKAGDIITIADVYAVNPVSKDTLDFLQPFVVTADVTSGAGGAATLALSPSITTSGGGQNVSAGPANDAAITIVSGTGSSAHKGNMAFNPQTFALAVVPLVMPKGIAPNQGMVVTSGNGLSLRMISDYDWTNDLDQTRIDILFGTATLYAETGFRVWGK